MVDTPPEHMSLWIATAPGPTFPRLLGDLTVDVAILGGGIAGLTTATLLKQAGKTVAVIEADQVVRGVTGYTTAKVTAQHNLIYADLIDTFGEDAARIYAHSNQAALERIAQFVAEDGIDCDFERKPNYCYSESATDLTMLEEEVTAAQNLGLPASLVTATGLPFPVAGALRVDHQAQFHPRKYLLQLAARIPGAGSFIFEHTRALDVEESNPHRVITDQGVLQAQDVVVATHYPILDRGLFFARVFPRREYVICVRANEGTDPHGMYISIGEPTRSVRTAPSPDGLLLVIGGEKHRPGEDPDTNARYRQLEHFARERFGCDQVVYRWSTQDTYAVDRVPYIGRLRPGADHLYVATGFGAWGMTNGTLAGMIIADAILGVVNPWAELYYPSRLNLRASAAKLLKEGANVARHFIGDRLAGGETFPDAIPPGEGAIVNHHGEKVAVYKDEQGKLHGVSPVCTHLGCLVGWNTAEKSWDCPCHGSRFDVTGQVIHGPAVANLAQQNLADRSGMAAYRDGTEDDRA
ncbi:MAG TPA: FAD-dependent oxidoreductase [Herpetosiphonaceae bacterium]